MASSAALDQQLRATRVAQRAQRAHATRSAAVVEVRGIGPPDATTGRSTQQPSRLAPAPEHSAGVYRDPAGPVRPYPTTTTTFRRHARRLNFEDATSMHAVAATTVGLHMVQDLVFAIDGNDARLSRPVSLREVGPPTADSYTEWIIDHPELLGTGVRIVATDLRWKSDRGTDEVAIDVLGLGTDGRPVVGAVVIDGDPLGVIFSALTQAAYTSRITPQTLADMHASYLRAHGQPVDEDTAMQGLAAHADGQLRPDLLARPRMVVFAEQMSPAVLTTVLWLDQMGLDMTVHRLRAHDAGGQALLIVSRVFPGEVTTEFAGVRARRFAPGDRGDDELGGGRHGGGTPQDDDRPAGLSAEHGSAVTNGFGHDR